MKDRQQIIQGYLAAAATLLMWSGFSLVSRFAGKSVLTPYDVFALRVLAATLALLPFAAGMPWRVFTEGRLWGLILLSSLLYCPIVYTGFKYAPAAHGGILLSGMQPFLISIVAWIIAGTRPGRARLGGLSLIAAGIVCAAMPYLNDWSPEHAFGDLLILVGSISWAVYSVLATRWNYSAWTLTRAIAFGSAFVYLPIYWLWLPKEISAAPLSTIAGQAIFQGIFATILAMLAYLKAITLLGTERAAAFLALVPVVIGLLAVPLLGEPLTPWLGGGIAFVSLGSYIASRYGRQS